MTVCEGVGFGINPNSTLSTGLRAQKPVMRRYSLLPLVLGGLRGELQGSPGCIAFVFLKKGRGMAMDLSSLAIFGVVDSGILKHEHRQVLVYLTSHVINTTFSYH
jgi:hypothetical protein